MTHAKLTTEDPWVSLRRFTDARIGLGRCGSSLPLRERLAFKMAWARARDAVQKPLDRSLLAADLYDTRTDIVLLESRADSRHEYLLRPDFGRRLTAGSIKAVKEQEPGCDLCLVICDGLSSCGVQNNCAPVIKSFLTKAREAGYSCSPIFLVQNGRVAIGDEIGEVLNARMSVLLIGERPGLSSPDSLGGYLTWQPQIGTTDEARNCISNIRPGGLAVDEAVQKLCYLVEESFRLQLSGVGLKDRMGAGYLPFQQVAPAEKRD